MSSTGNRAVKTPKPSTQDIIKAHIEADIKRKEDQRQQHLRDISIKYIKDTTGFYLDTTNPLHKSQFGDTPLYIYQNTTTAYDLTEAYKRRTV